MFREGSYKLRSFWINRMVSTIHALSITTSVLYMIFIDDGLGMGFQLWDNAMYVFG